jgi:lipopolysaccharide export system permease protein
MRTIRRLIYREVVVSVAFVTLAFLALFFFFDLVDELRWVGGWAGYQLTQALLFVALGHAQPPVRAAAHHRADRHHLRDGRLAELGIHHHAHQRPGPRRRCAPCWCWAALCAHLRRGRLPGSDQRTRGRPGQGARQGQITTGATGAWLKERKAIIPSPSMCAPSSDGACAGAHLRVR